MLNKKGAYFFTSESVGIGHPDKICDAISDAILDACLKEDPNSRVAIETLVTTNTAIISGEVTTNAQINYEQVAKEAIREIGYTSNKINFDYSTVNIDIKVHAQSPDISQGVTEGQGLFKEQGAGDQGIMFGFATNETANYMPLAIDLAHKIVKKAKDLRESGEINYIYPDCKSQVTICYKDNKPDYIEAVVFSTHHKEEVNLERIREDSIKKIITPICGNLINEKTKIYVNPTGKFAVGGPDGDTGLTGRKIIVDTYGGYGRHGGGAFSGKDPSKVDRSAAYAARWVAKNIVAAGLADKCEIQLSYAIGYPEPLNITVETYGTGKFSDETIEKAIRKVFNLSPGKIITELNLKKPIYQKTSSFGHFGQKPEGDFFPWEKLNKVEELRETAFNL
jgi:S-adenosylmethionine synthetase